LKAIDKALHKYLVVCLVLAIGTSLLVSCTAPPLAQLSSNEEDTITYQVVIDFLGTKQDALLDSQGRLKNSAQLTSADGKVSLSIDKDTRLLDMDKKPLQHLQFFVTNRLTLSPEKAQIISSVYQFLPEGATADPPLRPTLSYDPKELPKDVSESNIYIAPYNEGTGWGEWSYRIVDTENHRVTTQVSQFSKFAILSPLAPAPSQTTPKPMSGVDLASKSLAQALSSGKPTLAEFGWRTCIPCKEMKPILEALSVEYEGKLEVVIVEVYEQEKLTNQYGIKAIPTQILFDSKGKEIMRHAGLWTRAEIITQLKK